MATLSSESAPDVVGLNDDPPSDRVHATRASVDVYRPDPSALNPQQQIGELTDERMNGGESAAGAPSYNEIGQSEASTKNQSSFLGPQLQSHRPPKEVKKPKKQAALTKNLTQQRKTPEKSPRRRLSSNLYLAESYRKVHSNMVTICSNLCTVSSSYNFSNATENESGKLMSLIDSSIQSMQSNVACQADLPTLISQELNRLESKIEFTMHEVQRCIMDQNGQSNNQGGEAVLANARNVLERTKKSSIDLAGMFYALKEKQSKDQLDSTHHDFAATATASSKRSATDRSTEKSIDSSQARLKSKRASKGLKQLGVIRKRQYADNPTVQDEVQTISTQFLSNQVTSMNYIDDTITAPGRLLEIAARVTDGGATPMEDVAGNRSADEDVTDERRGERLDHDAYMNCFPTMAPPMTPSDIDSKYDSGVLDESVYATFTPKIRGGKKKGTKRRRTEHHNKNEVHEDARPRSKKKRARSSKSPKETTNDDTLKRSDSLISTDSRSSYPTDVRILPDTTSKPKTHIIDGDDDPQRICNPLLTLPQFPSGNDPPLDEIPTGGELWNIASLHFADPDTYPMSYLARLLGFDVPEVGNGVPFAQEFDPMNVPVMKSDPWMDVPDGGIFCDQVWKKVDDDDAFLSYMDPLWAHILQTFRGYNESDFKDAGKGYQAHLSPLVLEFAEKRSILKKDQISFRMATVDDEDSLRRLDEKCQCRHLPKQDLATCLRTPGNFCIIAESANSVPLAFVQYRFCWYKVEEKKTGSNQMTSYGVKSRAGEAVDKISELVFFIDNVVYVDSFEVVRIDDTANIEANAKPINHTDVETARILLVSLALIHSWSHNVWYGMMESPAPLVSFYAKYFRMITVGKQKACTDSHSSPMVPLVCDLKKCSFRYAILLREESLKSNQLAQASNAAQPSVNQRMLVHISDTADVLKSLQKSYAGGNESVASTFSNATSRSLAKQIQIRIPLSQAHELCPEIISVSRLDGQETSSRLDISSLNVSASWKVFKLFSRRGEGPKTETAHCLNENFFVAELTKKQTELQMLESSIETTSRHLLSEAYNDCLDFQLGDRKVKREREKKLLKDFEAVKQRLHEADLAWQAQLEQDMDAVCDVCWDGEVTPENQIIFCDSCNVAVHQGCYGIDRVPSGNFFCHPCIYYGKNNEFLAAERRESPRSAPTRTPIVCELCPRRQGAFVQTVTAADSLRKPRWVHVGCAKWQGIHYVDVELKDKIEDLTELKQNYLSLGQSCALCKSNIGALHQCRAEGCKKWLHLTCARCVGTCSVQHGENCEGPYPVDSIPFPAWSLACIEHSEVDPESVRKNSITVEQLRAIAKSYPPEPVPPKPFNKMNAKERREYWADSDNLAIFFQNVMSNKFGAQCNVCAEFGGDMEQCETCGVFFHRYCVSECLGCRYTREQANSVDFKKPKCIMCNETRGMVVRTVAKPTRMKNWKNNMAGFNRSLFGPNKFCHITCGWWNTLCHPVVGQEEQELNTSAIVMGHGRFLVSHQYNCFVCCMGYGAKVNCSKEGCVGPSGNKKEPLKMHVTCARAAGFEVAHDDDKGFYLRCFHHSENGNNLRAKLEDLLEVEIVRSPNKKLDKVFTPMSWDHAASIFHSAVSVLRVLGWAWRWAEWWVAEGDNWEPFLEEGQVEENMTDEELRKVRSTPDSRCKDARQCRLAAFGAALRNRDYDKEEGDDQLPLERALRAVLSVPSLVGPLRKKEIDFFVLWLSLAYRSRSPWLGFGDDKIPVANDSFCVHIADGSPKYELGNRPLPGKAEPSDIKSIFEPTVEEIDDFLQTREIGEMKKY